MGLYKSSDQVTEQTELQENDSNYSPNMHPEIWIG